MHPRTASHALDQLAAYLELHGENQFKVRAYRTAAKSVAGLAVDSLGPLLQSGELAVVRGLGPATIAVIRDLVETGESRYLEQLRESTPEGLLEMLAVPGLTADRIHLIHHELGVDSVEALEETARSGRLGKVKGFGPKTVEKILKGIALLRESGALRLYHHALLEGRQLVEMVAAHPDVTRAAVAGALRRHRETVGAIDVVAACAGDPEEVASSFTRVGGVARASLDRAHATIHFADGAHLELRCVTAERFGAALWRATGSSDHVSQVTDRLAAKRIAVNDDALRDSSGNVIPTAEEEIVYELAGIAFVEPELREGLGEVDAGSRDALPALVAFSDIQGALHCHTHYSDGKATVAQMAAGAQARGWSYLGISDHSEAAFYAGGMSRERVLAQLEEIDALNSGFSGFRLLKGIEADILVDGRLDYDREWLSRFDFVIGSIHARFNMDGAAMTTRVLAALDDPMLTVLAHPTGRLLLNREPYGLDVDAVLRKAAERGVAVELNADPHRLDLDWRYLPRAKELGVTVSIGPDAHSVNALDNVEVGVGMARKGWLEASNVLNTRSADEIVSFARARRAEGGSGATT
jgi:DNA polymerase (family 10)